MGEQYLDAATKLGKTAGYAVRNLSRELMAPIGSADTPVRYTNTEIPDGGIPNPDRRISNSSAPKPDRTRLYVLGAVIGVTALALEECSLGLIRRSICPNNPVTTGTSTATFSKSSGSTSEITSQAQTTTEATSRNLPPLNLGLNDLGGYSFHNYNGMGSLGNVEPLVTDIDVVAESRSHRFTTTPERGVFIFKDLPRDSYTIRPVHRENKFRYMWRSGEEVVDTKQGYKIDFTGKLRLDMALGEGFANLPLTSKTKYSIARYYDWDPSSQKYLWWNGKKGFISEIGGDANHTGVDFDVPIGTDVVALAPGVVSNFETGPQGQLGLTITHSYGDLSIYYSHLSHYTVKMNQKVVRGQKVAESGMTGAVYPHLHINNYRLIGSLQQLYDFYKPIFPLTESLNGYWERKITDANFYWKTVKEGENPNGQGFWIVNDDPKFSV